MHLWLRLTGDKYINAGGVSARSAQGMKRSADPVEHPRASRHGRVLVGPQLPYAAATLSCLLALCGAKAAEVAAPAPQDAQAIDQGGLLPVAPAPPGTRGGPSPELPEIAPKPP